MYRNLFTEISPRFFSVCLGESNLAPPSYFPPEITFVHKLHLAVECYIYHYFKINICVPSSYHFHLPALFDSVIFRYVFNIFQISITSPSVLPQ